MSLIINVWSSEGRRSPARLKELKCDRVIHYQYADAVREAIAFDCLITMAKYFLQTNVSAFYLKSGIGLKKLPIRWIIN